jgi:hypothetical protein
MSSQKSWSSSSSSCSNSNYTQNFDEILYSNFTTSDQSDSTIEMTNNNSNNNPYSAAIVHSSAILDGLNFLRENQILCDVNLIAEGKLMIFFYIKNGKDHLHFIEFLV